MSYGQDAYGPWEMFLIRDGLKSCYGMHRRHPKGVVLALVLLEKNDAIGVVQQAPTDSA